MLLLQHMFDIMIIEIYPLKSMQPNHPNGIKILMVPANKGQKKLQWLRISSRKASFRVWSLTGRAKLWILMHEWIVLVQQNETVMMHLGFDAK
jgi:hypothetical protein